MSYIYIYAFITDWVLKLLDFGFMDIDKLKMIIQQNKLLLNKRILEFKSVWNKGSDKALFIELAFCLLTPQSKARNAWSAIENLLKDNILFTGDAENISQYLNVVRFKNNKAKYIVEARDFFVDSKNSLKDIISSFPDDVDKRTWFEKNVKGIGLKEAGHFLRNIGFVENLAILDRHVLKNLVRLDVIGGIPKTLSRKMYFEIERKMNFFSDYNKLPMEYFDLALWFNEAGEIFK